MEEVSKDLTAGTVGGIAQLVVGHPFDTIKVKLQSQPSPSPSPSSSVPRYCSAMDALKKTISQEGPRGLFKGMGAPLASVAALNAVLFSARGQMENILRRFHGIGGGEGFSSSSASAAHLSILDQMVCGVGAGASVSVLACPTELVKCRLQAQGASPVDPREGTLATARSVARKHANSTLVVASGVPPGHTDGTMCHCPGHGPTRYKGPLDVALRVLRSEGGPAGLFTGLAPTMLREIPGNAIMFGAYEALKRALAGGRPDTSPSLGVAPIVAAGGLAGSCYWLSVYPADVVKSAIQVDDPRNPKYRGTLDAFRKIYSNEGLKGLYKGFSPAMARSIPANAACFLAYEIVKSNLDRM